MLFLNIPKHLPSLPNITRRTGKLVLQVILKPFLMPQHLPLTPKNVSFKLFKMPLRIRQPFEFALQILLMLAFLLKLTLTCITSNPGTPSLLHW
jgi:hypothetical protein